MISVSVFTRRLKFWLRLIQAFTIRYRLRVSVSVLLLILLFFAILSILPKISRANVISVGYVGSYTIESIPAEILSLVTQPLVETNEQGQPIPSLASHWTVSEDGKTYIVFLKDNIKWQDGTTVDTSNISLAISNIEITALNNKAIEFKLPTPISSFPQALNKPVFKSQTYYGTGQYRIVGIDRAGDIVKKLVLRPKDKRLPIVEIKFYQTQKQAADAIKIGEVRAATIPSGDQFQSWNNLQIEQETNYTQVITLFFNLQDPNLSSKDLRQALLFAVNRAEFDGEAANSPLSPLSWAYNDTTKTYNYNTGRSKELLSKLQTENLSLAINVSPGLEDIAASIKEDWEAIGLSVELQNVTKMQNDFQILLAVNELTPDPDQYGLWHSTQQQSNITNYKDARIDKLLEDGRSTNNEEERKEIYIDFQQSLMEDLPAAFLFYPHKYRIVYKNSQGLVSKLPIKI